mgnify:CR=1 FL=1
MFSLENGTPYLTNGFIMIRAEKSAHRQQQMVCYKAAVAVAD